MKLENFGTEKAIRYFEEQVSRSQSDRMHKRPLITATISEKRLYDVQIASEYFYKECAQHCYNKNNFEQFLIASDLKSIKLYAKDDYFDEQKFEDSLKKCYKFLLDDIETKNIFL
jgi:hypothetical protein